MIYFLKILAECIKMKNDGILIKLDKELKDEFKEYCLKRKTTMTKEVLRMINDLISSEKSNLENSNYKSDLNFFMQEYQYMKRKLNEVNKITRALTARTDRRSISFYEKLLYNDFYNIDQFRNYTLISTYDMCLKGTISFNKFPNEIVQVIKEYSKDFEKIPYVRASAIAIDPKNHQLINICFRPSYTFINSEIQERFVDYDNLLTILIVTSDEPMPNELIPSNNTFYPMNKNCSFTFYHLENIFPSIRDDSDETKYWSRK